MPLPSKHNEDKTAPSRDRGYLQYADMAFRMGAIILIGAFAGKKLDEWLALPRPYMTILFSLMAVAGALYSVFRDLMKKPEA